MKRFSSLFLIALALLAGACSLDGDVTYVTATPWIITATPDVTSEPSATPTPSATITAVQTSTATDEPTATEDPTPTQEVMRIGYNINAEQVPDWNYLWRHLDRLQPHVLLFMNGVGAACEAAHRYPDAIVIHRTYSGHEGREWDRRSTAEWIAQWQAEGCKEVVRYTTNEPSLYDIPAFVQSEIDLMNAAAAAGFRVSAGNFAVGAIPEWAINSGLFDEWLRTVQRHGHILGTHEYTTGILPFGVGQYSRQQLADPAAMAPSTWPLSLPMGYVTVAQGVLDPVTSPFGLYEQSIAPQPAVAQAARCDGTLPGYWHILRTTWLLIRAECIGLDAAGFTVVDTEGLWDNMSDIDIAGVITPIQDWRAQYGIERYMWDMRGINSYENLWRAYYPQWSTAEAAVCQMKWWDFIAPPQYAGVAIFTWSTNTFWISFDVSGVQAGYLYEVHELLEYWSSGGDMRDVCGDYAWAA